MGGIKGVFTKARGAVEKAKGVVEDAKDAKHVFVSGAIGKAGAGVIGYALPAALQSAAVGMLPAADAKGFISDKAQQRGRDAGEKMARWAVEAMMNAETSAKQAIESALPVFGVAAYAPPVALYTGVDECGRVRPTLETFAMALPEAMQAMGTQQCDKVVELYAQVVDRGKFEDELCRGADGDEAKKVESLLAAISDLVARSTETAVAVAEMLRGKPSSVETATGKMRREMYAAAVGAAKPVSGIFYGTTTKSAQDLRNLEVVVRQLRPDPKAELTQDERELVALVREKAWLEILEGRRVDMTRLGSRYGVVPLPVLRECTVQLLPDPVPHASEVANFGLGEWGLLDSLRRVVRFAVERFRNSDPERAAKVRAYADRGQSLGQELLGLYVVQQHVGFERAGAGYALAVGTGTLRALPRTKEYAHAVLCMLWYVRALLLDTDGGDAGIDRVVGGLRAPPTKDARKGAAEYMPAVPRACRGAPEAHDARTRGLVREVCAQNGELVEKARALRWLEDTFGAEGDITVDAMFEMHEGLGALAAVKQQRTVWTNVRKTLARLEYPSLTVAQWRRLEVVQTRVAEVVGGVKAKDTGAAVYAHVAAKAKDNEPHGLDAHELGVAHTAFNVGPTVVYRAPLVEADVPAHGSWMGALLARLVPDRVQSVVDAASDAASGRKVQYRGCEPPGVGYALYALLPVLDHASAMCKAGAGEYASVQRHTLRAVGRLLSHRVSG